MGDGSTPQRVRACRPAANLEVRVAASVEIREEAPGDRAAISSLTTAAFKDAQHKSGTEARIVDDLRAAGALSLSLVAVDKAGEILGHVAFSPVLIDGRDIGWYGLGPLSVAPARQRTGIGSALVEAGLSRLTARAAAGCVLVGDPAYYSRFGFSSEGAPTMAGVPSQYVLARRLTGSGRVEGAVRFHEAFGV
nr:N-acetyltransferase [Chthonobacter albigriseus]